MTWSVHWVTGETRPVESFATVQLQRKQSTPLVSDYKSVVQTIERAWRPLETDPRFGPQSPQAVRARLPGLRLRKADVDPDEEGSDDEWWTQSKQRGVWGVIELFSKDASFSLGSLSARGRASQHDTGVGDSF